MKRLFSILLLLVFIFSLGAPALAAAKKKVAVKKKVVVVKKKVVKKAKKAPVKRSVRKRWPAGGRPVFPVYKGKAPPPAEKKAIVIAPVPERPKKAMKSGFFAEGGLGGGALLLSGGYQVGLMDKMTYAFEAGYGIGSNYNVMVLDLARVSYDMGSFFLGGGMNYAMYSDTPSNILGLSGKLSSKNMLGIEVLGGTRFRDNMVARVGYSTALGLRASVSYEF
jgi:hypothetical protein